MPMTHPVHVMRVQPALPALSTIAAVATVMRRNPQCYAHHGHDQWSEQISHHRFSHRTLRRGRDRSYREWLYFRRFASESIALNAWIPRYRLARSVGPDQCPGNWTLAC